MLEYTRTDADGIPSEEDTVIRYEREPCAGGTRLTVRESEPSPVVMALLAPELPSEISDEIVRANTM